MATIGNFRLEPADLRLAGSGLSRPECIVAERDGSLWISDNRGGVTYISPTGGQRLVGSISGDPNGIAMESAGTLLVANIGDGKLYRLDREGRAHVVVDSLDGRPLGAVNFVLTDVNGIWITVSTRAVPRSEAVQKPRPDGYVILIDDRGPRIAAEGFHFTNEIRFDRQRRFAYIAETALGRVVRLPLREDLSLGGPVEVFGPPRLFDGALIDGITFDSAGNLWVTEITRNALAVIEPDGRSRVVFEDPAATVLNFPTSITFGGPDLDVAYIGSLKMDHILSFRAPIPGEPLSHWLASAPSMNHAEGSERPRT